MIGGKAEATMDRNGEDDGPFLLHHTQMPLEASGSSE